MPATPVKGAEASSSWLSSFVTGAAQLGSALSHVLADDDLEPPSSFFSGFPPPAEEEEEEERRSEEEVILGEDAESLLPGGAPPGYRAVLARHPHGGVSVKLEEVDGKEGEESLTVGADGRYGSDHRAGGSGGAGTPLSSPALAVRRQPSDAAPGTPMEEVEV